MHRSPILAVALSVMIAFSFALSGCGTKKEETPPPAVHYGVADLETLVKAHPKYSEYFKLETEYNHMLEQYQTERNKLIQSSSKQKQMAAALADTSRRVDAQNELQTRVKAKEDELNDGLQKLYGDIEKKHTTKAGTMTLETLTPEERAQMANLQMKLTVLGVTGEEKEQVKEELHKLMDLRTSREKADMGGWTEDEVKQMTDAKAKAQTELEDYSNSVAEEIKNRLAQDTQADISAEEDNFAETHKEWDDNWQARIDDKQKQMAVLKKEIMADIEQEAARVASEKNLDMIFSKYKANINADDVTGDLVNRIVNIKK